jgi:hypothetical protein
MALAARQNERNERLDPKLTKLRSDRADEQRPNDRREKEEPRFTPSMTDIAKQLPAAASPQILRLDPRRATLRSESEDPQCAAPLIENFPPSCMLPTTETSGAFALMVPLTDTW